MASSPETVCWSCKQSLTTNTLTVNDHRYHLLCWRCEECSKLFYQNSVVDDFYHKNNLAVCADCADKGPVCGGCGSPISYREPQGQVITALEKRWHLSCFVCTSCQKPITKLKHAKSRPDLPFCGDCPTTVTPEISQRLEEKLKKRSSLSNTASDSTPGIDSEKIEQTETKADRGSSSTKPSCYGCNEIIESDILSAADHEWHNSCFKCNECFLTLDSSNFFHLGHRIVCSSCMVGTLL